MGMGQGSETEGQKERRKDTKPAITRCLVFRNTPGALRSCAVGPLNAWIRIRTWISAAECRPNAEAATFAAATAGLGRQGASSQLLRHHNQLFRELPAPCSLLLAPSACPLERADTSGSSCQVSTVDYLPSNQNLFGLAFDLAGEGVPEVARAAKT